MVKERDKTHISINDDDVSDFLLEYTRIANEQGNPTSRILQDKLDDKVENHHFQFPRMDILTIEYDLRTLTLKNTNNANKLIQPIRKTLHREIFDWLLIPLLTKQTDFNYKIKINIARIYAELDSNHEYISQIINRLNQQEILYQLLDKNKKDLENKNAILQKNIQQLNTEHDDLEKKFQTVHDDLEAHVHPNISFGYFNFEKKFRGSEDLIKSRLQPYLDYVKAAMNNSKGEFMLDIGYGRGEFLEILKNNKILAKGVDSNQEMFEFCKKKELDVFFNDALDFLNTLPNDKLIGITSFQVIEHFPVHYMLKLIQLAYQKISNNGVLILETVNPISFFSLSRFWTDITHEKPLLPDTIKFYVENVGFKETQLLWLNPIPKEQQLQGNDPNIVKLNELLYGPQDYALVAWKK